MEAVKRDLLLNNQEEQLLLRTLAARQKKVQKAMIGKTFEQNTYYVPSVCTYFPFFHTFLCGQLLMRVHLSHTNTIHVVFKKLSGA